jgi:hypothetical protein
MRLPFLPVLQRLQEIRTKEKDELGKIIEEERYEKN